MTPDTILTLGDFAFLRTEVPEKIAFGGDQIIQVQQLQGGVRIVDVMGPSDRPLDWSGRFRGQDALARARYLDGLRKAGKPLTLAWSELIYTVVIRSFVADFERFYEIPYSISCEVVEDLAAPVESPPDLSLDDAMGDDMDFALGLGGEIGDSGLLGFLSGLQSALGGVSDLFNAGEAALGSIFDPLFGAMDAVSSLILTAEAVADVSTLGGVVTSGQPSDNPATLSLQTANADTLGLLYGLQSLLGRMGTNLGAVGSSGQTVFVAGGNLQALAAARYGDPSQWTAIAKANNLTDPVITGAQEIRLPVKGDTAGGILDRA